MVKIVPRLRTDEEAEQFLDQDLSELDFSQFKPFALKKHAGMQAREEKTMPDNEDHFYIERRAQGDYAVRRGGSDRASAVTPTQSEAIDRAKRLDPQAPIHVERVRHTGRGNPDKWRKA